MLDKSKLWLWLVPILLLMTYLGARSLNADLLFVDEYWSIRNSGGAFFGPLSPAEIWQNVIEKDPGGVGILYYNLLAGWGALVGWTEFAARAFSLMMGLLAVAMTYRLGSLIFTPKIGLYAAAILGLSAFYIDYLHEMRSYTLYAFLTVSMLYVYWRLIHQHNPSRWLYLALGVSFVGLAYTHYVALAAVAALGLYHLLFVPKNRNWWLIVDVMLISALCYFPWMEATLDVIQKGTEQTLRHETSMKTSQVLETMLYTFSNGNIALLMLLMAYTLLERRKSAFYIWFIGIVTLIAALIVNNRIPFMVHIRYLMVLLPLFALIVALGIHHLEPSRRGGILILLVWLAVGIWQSFNPAFIGNLFGQIYRAPAEGIHLALDTVRTYAHADEGVLFHISQVGFEPFNYFPLSYYMNDFPQQYDQFERMNNSFSKDDNSYLQDVVVFTADKSALWTLVIPDLPTTQHSDVVQYVLRTQFTHCERVMERDDLYMDYYMRILPQDMPSPYRFTSENQANVDLIPIELKRYEDDLRIILGTFKDRDVANGSYSLGFHFEDTNGQLIAQADYPLPDTSFGCIAGHIPIANLPSGDYSLLVTIYNWQTGARQQGANLETSIEADRLVIGTIRIE